MARRTPLLLDHLRIRPAAALDSPGVSPASTALGTLLATPARTEDLDAIRSADIACTLVDGVLMARTLAAGAETVRRRLQALWQRLRPTILPHGRVAAHLGHLMKKTERWN